MKNIVFSGLIVLTFTCFTSCRKGEETNRFELSQEDQNFIPYKENASIPFAHSGGFEFSLLVQQRSTYWERTDIIHQGDDYVSYQVDKTTLVSDEPELNITIAVYPVEFSHPLELNINRHEFYLYSREHPTLDSLTSNGKVYRNVYVLTQEYPNSTNIVPDSIFYTREEGIFNIKMTNDDEFFLNR